MSLLLDEEELEQRIKVEKVDKFEKVDKVKKKSSNAREIVS